MFRAGPGYANRVGFLKGVIADHMGWHLPGHTNQGDTVHQRIGEACDAIRGTRPGSDQRHSDASG